MCKVCDDFGLMTTVTALGRYLGFILYINV